MLRTLILLGALTLLFGAGCSDGDGTCACSQPGLFACVDSQTIRTCDGCSWKTLTCDALCGINKGSGWEMDPQKGCKAESAGGDEICWCRQKATPTVCKLTWTITDTCDDGESPKVGFYDLKEVQSWGPFTLPPAKAPLKTTLSCKCGSKICYGAWQGTTYWGCGEKCQKACTDCCTPCTDGATTTDLNC